MASRRLFPVTILLLCFSISGMGQVGNVQLPPCVTGEEISCSLSPTAAGAMNPAAMGQQTIPGGLNPADLRSGQTSTINDSNFQQPNNIPPRPRPVLPPTEFEQMVADTVGVKLKTYGMSLFTESPTTFAQVTKIALPSDYVVGPGDEVNVRIWGPTNISATTTVDRSGAIYLPQVGSINVAGVQYSQLEGRIKSVVDRVFRSSQLSATLGRLRSVQVFVVGEAAAPGQYTVSSLSTLVNAIFASGGPGSHGSLRHIQLRRGSEVVTDLDLYDLLIRGDKSKDVQIKSGDVITFLPVGGLAAIAGSVGVPAIFELGPNATLDELITDAGGLTVMADDQRLTVERIDKDKTRSVVEVRAADAKNFKLQNGDIVRAISLVPRFDNTVTMRGNVANPGRYRWTPGMRVRDLIPDVGLLLTREYWLKNALLTSGTLTQYPIKVAPVENSAASKDTATKDTKSETTDIRSRSTEIQQTIQAGNRELDESRLTSEIRNSSPNLNWGYALIQRTNPNDLSTTLIPFDLGGAVIDKNEKDNLELQSGDIVTIFSQNEIAVPEVRKTKFLKIEGEVNSPGIYKILPGDTLRKMVERAGGLTPNAYLFGARLTRVSVQEQQQKSLDAYVQMLSTQLQQASTAAARGNPDQAASLGSQAAVQQQMLQNLRNLRAPGRIVLELLPTAGSVADFPEIALEDGDNLVVPSKPVVVNVIGSVYNQGSFLFNPKRKLSSYFDLAGRSTPIADKGNMFIIRADGAVISKKSQSGMWKGSFSNARLYPGDTLVVPSKLQTGAFQRNLRDWTQILSQIALTAASLAVVAKQ